jgi:lipoate-protein ligase A
VRVAVLNARCVTFGVGVDRRASFLRRAEAEGIRTVPRRTGGTGLLHEVGDLSWSVVLPRDDPRVGPDFTRAYARLGRGVVGWLAAHAAPARWDPAPDLARSYCTLGERGSVLTVENRILGGAAQHAVRTGLLHHGMISRTVDRPTIDRLFDLGSPSPTARLGSLVEQGLTAPTSELARELADAIAADLRSG